MEIYNEVIKDLLRSDTPTLAIREDRSRGVFLDCEEETISEIADVMELLSRGEALRHVGETDMNKRSSRSHTIFSIIITSKPKDGGCDAAGMFGTLVGKLNLVDLAGSESVRTTGAVRRVSGFSRRTTLP